LAPYAVRVLAVWGLSPLAEATVDGKSRGVDEGNKEAAMAVVTQPKPTGTTDPPLARAASEASIELYWLPLGAGGWFVKLNGRIWEAIHARLEHRRPQDLYHTALVVRLPEGRFVVENCWPIPDGDGPSRGVVVQGPVASRRMERLRVFRYRCAAGGTGSSPTPTRPSPAHSP
jgi:hypothetical protein